MAVVFNAKGTSVNSFQIGKQGSSIKNSSGTLEARNLGDTDWVDFKAKNLFIDGNQLSNTVTTFDSDTFTGTGSQTAFTLSRSPVNNDAILVVVSGLVQDGGVDYTVSGTTLTFTTAPPSSAKILVLFRDILTTGTLIRDNFTGDGSTTGFTLSEDPGVAANLLVFVDGVTQYTPDAYTVSGTTLTFTSAPAGGADVQTVQLNATLSSLTPSDGSVSHAKLDSDLQGNFGSNKNVIINGNFDIWQRGTSVTAPSTGDYTADRFVWTFVGAGVVDILRSASVPDNTSDFSLQVDVTTADASIAATDFYALEYRVEGFDTQRFGFGTSDAQELTLSFWVRSAKTGIHCVTFINNAVDRNYIIEYTVNSADTWEFKSISLTADTIGTWATDNTKGLQMRFALAVGSNFHGSANTWQAGNLVSTSNQVNVMDNVANNFHLSRVQIELGSTATSFERKSYAQELSMAQRYYYTQSSIDFGFRQTSVAATLEYIWSFPVTMRTNPAVTQSGFGFTNCSFSSISVQHPDALKFAVSIASSNAYTATGGTLTADAEL